MCTSYALLARHLHKSQPAIRIDKTTGPAQCLCGYLLKFAFQNLHKPISVPLADVTCGSKVSRFDPPQIALPSLVAVGGF